LDPVQEALLQEQCILVDEQDRPRGQASKRECHLLDAEGESPLHRAFSLFVFNEKNELLMQQRSNTKITFPGGTEARKMKAKQQF
jgi:isopentenyl-diphosphate delta-isomerase